MTQASTSPATPSTTRPRLRASPRWPRRPATRSSACPATSSGTSTPPRRATPERSPRPFPILVHSYNISALAAGEAGPGVGSLHERLMTCDVRYTDAGLVLIAEGGQGSVNGARCLVTPRLFRQGMEGLAFFVSFAATHTEPAPDPAASAPRPPPHWLISFSSLARPLQLFAPLTKTHTVGVQEICLYSRPPVFVESPPCFWTRVPVVYCHPNIHSFCFFVAFFCNIRLHWPLGSDGRGHRIGSVECWDGVVRPSMVGIKWVLYYYFFLLGLVLVWIVGNWVPFVLLNRLVRWWLLVWVGVPALLCLRDRDFVLHGFLSS